MAACTAASGSAPAAAPDTAVHPALWPKATWPLPKDAALEQRVRALMAKMTLEEKVGQLIQADILSVTPDDVRKYRLGSILAGGNSKPGGQLVADAVQWKALADAFHRAAMDTSDGHVAIPLLFGIDAVHGHNGAVGATLFPQNSALGATHDPALMREIGAATAEEVRATGINWTFAPALAVPQDVRWGRSYEGYSQDPKLVAQYAGAMVEGLQGKIGTPQFLDSMHVVASAKHFLADGGTKDGKDQGDAQISEEILRTVHAAGYPPAIDAGVQSVMASFSSWNGQKMHGNKALITDVLKDRMDFQGFVVGDWNAHGQVPGCTNEDCPVSINAGIDMLMAPDSWRGLYEHTLAEAKSGGIPMARVDDAVARILRVKFRAGLFDAGLPSSNPLAARSADVVGSPAHRAIARRAVRESLVLLKNNGGVLPLDPRKHILVAGDGADNISRQSGGWTLTWQGAGLKNANFPGAQSIGAGIAEQVSAAGGTVEIAADGHHAGKPDAAVVVFGEDPYAEFQGDIPNLLYRPGDDHDLELIRHLRGEGVPVVAVFLSGRPLWMNREINAADAFVAAWLPGSEGGGVADVLLRTRDGHVAHDFHGKLSFAWPRSAVQGQGSPLFPLGYGLTYADHGMLPTLPETSGIRGEQVPVGNYLERGKPVHGYTFTLRGADGSSTPGDVSPAATGDGALRMTALDYKAQEDARRFAWSKGDAQLAITARAPMDLDRETNGDVLLITTLRIDALPGKEAWIGMACGKVCEGRVQLGPQLAGMPNGQWLRIGVSLKCFRKAGADMHHIEQPFVWSAGKGAEVAISRAALGTDADQVMECAR
ncbi:glycoside hydrolase family 3 N-terminal domain-containing protein [Dyella jiangningensis]|uniref:glycoside hydrolase family 3 protein n=1 Tax=Dyella jiangningensis TaxID=1379159 RepID=UPI00240EADE2|nr:glycoside hydrolase family 3 protein [Dyella jiangningensis]MDG2539006.1 glycoside hydrolase family 3 N-terminal domain-containing protein [Dyella jiangningensis]